ncbi:MAG: cytochrome c biogenesis protein CcsA [Nitrospinaceae bacterium]|nr:cytochrome c biogenesis protein CcsA [Nitrospinaceae bacterium]MBT3821086.1 cytochrome c biogenesis protein CcsA [Nitrospinaceae bacterium]MBT4094008.1 cytochrome c biogenesis protein CcsA [Nitrospinaceae bacterium]MBT4430204.1 cytochrome c biogenesis protein CcsA [Nitrospinaceae bacterium]MBT5367749.1 cytochrome c biogenesis protein CcsA [Nitrospinaceae bacterium]
MVAVLVGLYLISTIAHLYYLLKKHFVVSALGIGSLIGGFLLHTAMLGVSFSSPATRGWGVWLSALAWVIVFLYLGVFFRYKDMTLGGFAVPFGFVLEGYASAFPGVWGAGSTEVQGYLLVGHAVLALLSGASFFFLFGFSLMFVAQSRQLKSKRPSAWLHRLPSLGVLDDLNHKILYFGFTFLTASMLIGSMWAKARHGAYWSLDPMKTWPLVLVWGAYGVLLVCRLTRSWKGHRSAVFSMISFVAVILAIAVHI